MITIILAITLSVLNFNYTKTEIAKMCFAEKEKSKFCENKIRNYNRALIVLDDEKLEVDEE